MTRTFASLRHWRRDDRPGSFAHGIHPPEHKELTAHRPIERMPFVDALVLPLSQHIGAPSRAVVTVGDRVERGQLVAEPGGYVSVALHAPATGTIAAIERRLHPNGQLMDAIVLHVDSWATQRVLAADPVDPATLTEDQLVERIQRAGLVGLGGAAFPSHVKVKVPEGKRVRAVVINGAECEPYLTCDHRVMVERAAEVIRGTLILMDNVGARRAYIGVELNKPDAIAALERVAPPGVEVLGLPVKYPQGAEKHLIKAIFDREIPRGGLPIDLELVVNNVGTMAALADLFDRGQPLIERVITVSGPAIRHPKNLLVPIGTSLSAVIAHCGGLLPTVKQVVLGGPMMGQAQKSLDVPVLKGTSGVLCLDRVEITARREHPCIRCGRCVEACPMFLNPARLSRLVRYERAADLVASNLRACIECGSCSFVCPSGIPVVQYMRMGKAMVRAAEKAAS
ncbi:MAG: electron transport complex subunit RsxC [Deltaproteobacteria bacterium]|nr:MAG: electron transport complex subunit RsxC [Deltaproteobacteria bacterium]